MTRKRGQRIRLEWKDDPTDPSASATKDVREMNMGIMIDLIPFIATMLVDGGNVIKDNGGTEGETVIVFDGNEYILDEKAYEIALSVAEQIRKKIIPDRGISFPLKTSDIITIIHNAKAITRIELNISPSLTKILSLESGSQGCDFYRVHQIAGTINAQKQDTPLLIETSKVFSLPVGERYDVIVTSRLSNPDVIKRLQRLQKQGVIVIYEIDDLMDEIPRWSPAWHSGLADENENRKYMMKMADAIFVTTPELKEAYGYSDKTYILPNAIEPARWGPQKGYENPGAHILWMGSDTHENDLKPIVPTLRKLIDKYRKNIRITFMGYRPLGFLQTYSGRAGKKFEAIERSIADVVHFVEGVPMSAYPNVLADIGATIGIAPLMSIPFNERGKSEIKLVEMMGGLGLPVVASDVSPYRRTIRHQETGFLAKTPGEFETYLSRLIESSDTRQRIGANGQRDILSRYSIDAVRNQYEMAFMDVIAKKGTIRPEANEAVAARIAVLNAGGR